ncbi:BamA/TamA family outer membrane protein [Paucibacter sp. APW11]|uniref:BamA/TamA family outer membrane protein n=1 Tax=Roseateles aquae TaxID=3077235 RepID=A0ABU3PG46_9BURK|nr:BamA/TamA family outer membrane protein [Paucibacter sp. APW11]MDT9001496.1 BamA/TamA family outer membrane protein [Paucibacter sp. APW11]
MRKHTGRCGALPLLALLLTLGLSGCASISKVFDAPNQLIAAVSKPPQGKPAYALEVKSPSALRELLQKHMDLARFQYLEGAERLSLVELDRLSAAAPAQARALLETEGYFNAQVQIMRDGDGSAERPLSLTLQVDPGPRTLVQALQLDFAGALAPADAPASSEPPSHAEASVPGAAALRAELRERWSLKPGAAFSQSAWSEAKSQALAHARAMGYPLARWSASEARIEAADNLAELRLLLDSGPLFRLGELQIEGLQLQPAESVRRLAGFQPGQPLTEQLLLDYQERLLRTQLFDSAVVDIVPDAALADAVPVRVRLKEAPRQQATTGVGYFANSGERVTLEYVNRLPLGLPVRARGKLDLGHLLRNAELELSSHPQPDMQRNFASLQWQKDLSADGNVTSLSSRLGRLRETQHDERMLYLELLRSRELTDQGTVTGGAWSVNGQWIRRRVDNPLLPEDGYTALLLLGAGRADNSIKDSGAFARTQLKLGWYQPIGEHWYGSLRSEFGKLFAGANTGLPNRLLFQAGGDDSVRGYGYRSLGPVDAKGNTIGGRVVWTGSMELARPISLALPSVWGAVFIDAGQAANSLRELKPVYGWGAGVRWRSPVGPLRVDLARGQATGQWRVHFSVGIAL